MNFERLKRREFERGGTILAVHDAGGDGVPVVFQHGLCGDARQTAEAFPEDPRLRLITLECRGHGRSEPGDEGRFTLADFADDVAALIETLPGPVIVGGISMGAALSMRLAVRRPQLVRALMLVRPAWLDEAHPANLAPNIEVGRLLARLPPAEARAAFAEGETFRRLAAAAPDNLASLMGFFERQPTEITAALLVGISGDGPGVTGAELAAIGVPTLVAGTAQDAIHPLALARRLAGLIPAARFVEITPKAADRAAYVRDLHRAILAFTEEP